MAENIFCADLLKSIKITLCLTENIKHAVKSDRGKNSAKLKKNPTIFCDNVLNRTKYFLSDHYLSNYFLSTRLTGCTTFSTSAERSACASLRRCSETKCPLYLVLFWSERSACAALRCCRETKCPLYLVLFFRKFAWGFNSQKK